MSHLRRAVQASPPACPTSCFAVRPERWASRAWRCSVGGLGLLPIAHCVDWGENGCSGVDDARDGSNGENDDDGDGDSDDDHDHAHGCFSRWPW